MSDPQSDKHVIRFGHTPDPDDAFMFYGFWAKKAGIEGIEIQNWLEDIESLNKLALKKNLEITAISAAMYPFVANDYWIMPVGASVGRAYGPVVVRKKGGGNKTLNTIAIPGANTTAYLLYQLFGHGLKPVPMPFSTIPFAVLDGSVDAGIVIHEAQLTYESLGLEKMLDLGECWTKETGLPTPLGLDVIRKNIGRDMALKCTAAFRQSIDVAFRERDAAIAYALQFGRGLAPSLGGKFIDMYVNKDTLDMPADVETALNLLFKKGFEKKIFPTLVTASVLR